MAIPNKYRGFRVTRGDATGEQLAILLDNNYRVLHVASAADEATDWDVTNPTHPTFYVHSETTPATDYIALSHDGTDGTISVVGGTLALNGVTSLALQVSGTSEATLTATAFSPTTNDGNALGTTLLGWGDLHLATGGVINWANGEVTLTESTNALDMGGGDFSVADTFGVIVGATAQTAVGGVLSELEIKGTAPADSTVAIQAYSADAVAPRLYFAKSRGAIGAFDIITTGDNLGEILAFGADGVDFNSNANASAAIIFDSMGTIAADRIPGRITLQTATNAAPSVLTTFATIDSDQNMYVADANGLIVGHTAQIAVGGVTSELEMIGTATPDGIMSMQQYSADTGASAIFFGKSRGATIGTFDIITTGDDLGSIRAFGADGVDLNANGNASAAVTFAATGTIGADRVPGEIRFWSATDAAPSVLTQRWTIANTGNLVPTGSVTIGITGTRVTQSYHTNITSTNAVTVDSSASVKENIAPYTSKALDIVRDMSVVTYQHERWLDPSGDTKLGIIAESVGEPLALSEISRDGGDPYPGVNLYSLVAVLTKAVQELSAQVAK